MVRGWATAYLTDIYVEITTYLLAAKVFIYFLHFDHFSITSTPIQCLMQSLWHRDCCCSANLLNCCAFHYFQSIFCPGVKLEPFRWTLCALTLVNLRTKSSISLREKRKRIFVCCVIRGTNFVTDPQVGGLWSRFWYLIIHAGRLRQSSFSRLNKTERKRNHYCFNCERQCERSSWWQSWKFG